MGKEWIGNLVQDLKEKNREAAENYGREQHKAGIVTSEGNLFFASLTTCLETDLNEIKRQLQGDATSADTTFKTVHLKEVILTRSRFPWFDAHIAHQDPEIILNYAKGLGVAGDPSLDRKVCHFTLHVADDDSLSAYEAFGDSPKQFRQPGKLSEHILQILFSVPSAR
jgi:hypothetical protein